MRAAWDGICEAYLRVFCERHGYDFGEAFWESGDPGTVAVVDGMRVGMDVIRYDVDNRVPAGFFGAWHEYESEICGMEEAFRGFKDFRELDHLGYRDFCEGVPLPYTPEEMLGLRRRLSALSGPSADRSAEYIRVMSGLVGEDILAPGRRVSLSWPRYMVMYQLRLDGLTLAAIGACFGKDHSTVSHAVRVVGDMLTMPRMFPDETRLWRQFQNIISDE